jgi:hypothetical protein
LPVAPKTRTFFRLFFDSMSVSANFSHLFS